MERRDENLAIHPIDGRGEGTTRAEAPTRPFARGRSKISVRVDKMSKVEVPPEIRSAIEAIGKWQAFRTHEAVSTNVWDTKEKWATVSGTWSKPLVLEDPGSCCSSFGRLT